MIDKRLRVVTTYCTGVNVPHSAKNSFVINLATGKMAENRRLLQSELNYVLNSYESFSFSSYCDAEFATI
jgi:hypothetical protein